MGNKKYVAYVGTYTHGNSKGIQVYDVDVEKGTLKERSEVQVSNASHTAISKNGKFLYSIEDEGVAVFKRDENGDLTRINRVSIDGMRGCFLATDVDGKYLYVAGYHDGKVTVVHTRRDGSLGRIMDGVYHKGLGSVAERNFRPHVSCCRRTPDNKFVLAVDSGLDQVKIYKFDEKDEHLVQVDMIPCDMESAPRCFRFSSDGKFAYLLSEQKNTIDVFTYETGARVPKIEKIQTIATTGKKASQQTAACALRFSPDEKHMFCGNAGDETVSVYNRDPETGLLTQICCLPISGEYPKDIAVFPDDKHIACINHGSGTITFFKVDYEIKCNEPNSCAIVKVSD